MFLFFSLERFSLRIFRRDIIVFFAFFVYLLFAVLVFLWCPAIFSCRGERSVLVPLLFCIFVFSPSSPLIALKELSTKGLTSIRRGRLEQSIGRRSLEELNNTNTSVDRWRLGLYLKRKDRNPESLKEPLPAVYDFSTNIIKTVKAVNMHPRQIKKSGVASL